MTSPVTSAFPPLAHFTSKGASSHAAVISAYKKKTMGRRGGCTPTIKSRVIYLLKKIVMQIFYWGLVVLSGSLE